MSASLSALLRLLGILALTCLLSYRARAHHVEDFYEPDNAPELARWIDTDGSAQSHTFHKGPYEVELPVEPMELLPRRKHRFSYGIRSFEIGGFRCAPRQSPGLKRA